MMRTSLLWLAVLGLGGSVVSSAQAGDSITQVSPAELAALLETDSAPLVIDVRTSREFQTGHLPGALNIPYQDITQDLSALESEGGVALYCMKGPRARKAESALQAAGYASILHLEGGLLAWKKAGLPVEIEADADQP